MAKRISALVEGPVLAWARETAGYSIGEIAKRLKKRSEDVLAWERNEAHPFMGQVRTLANLYKRPISDFYLPAPPHEPSMPHDFRRESGQVAGRFSPALRKQLRFARERLELVTYLNEDSQEPLSSFGNRVSMDESAEDLGTSIRQMLNLSIQDQRSWRQPRGPLNAWRTKIEALGILVTQFEKVDVSEAWGFSISGQPYPLIGLNVSLAPNGRTFTLLHEFAHILLNQESICDTDDYTPRRSEELEVEVFCNHVAASTLMPEKLFRSELIVASRSDASEDWQEEEIRAIASSFGVSREAVVRRLVVLKLTTQQFYQDKRKFYRAQYEASRDRQRQENRGREIGINPIQRTLSNLGTNYVRAVLSSLGEQRITLADAANYLEVAAGKIPEIERRAWSAPAP